MITSTLYRSCRGLLIAFLLTLTACTSTSTTEPDQSTPTAARSAADWLRLAEDSGGQQRVHYQLQAAALYEAQGEFTPVAEILRSIRQQDIPTEDAANYLLLASAVIERERGAQSTLEWLAAAPQLALIEASQAGQQAQVTNRLAQLQDRVGEHLAAAETRIKLAEQLAEPQQVAANQDAIWRSLLQVPRSQLELHLAGELAPITRGWLELALIGQTLRGDMEQQVELVDGWQQQWPSHPAALQPPGELDLLRQLDASRPSQIAVLLPLQGKLRNAGNAIRDGMLSAHFNNPRKDSSQLRFYDTEANPDMAALYAEVVANGAELIIGPLTRNRVEAMRAYADGTVPLLALNYVPEDTGAESHIYEFGLSSNDDALAAAQLAAQKGYRRAFVIHGADNQGVRSARAFQEAWQDLDGATVATVEFDSERTTSEKIKQGLQIDLSQQRVRQLESITDTSLEYNPRRRQDIDFVYLPVGSQQARSIKPLLAFHFAGDLPVYATSRVNQGTPNPRRDADLNGLFFTDTPWALGAMPKRQQVIASYIERGGAPAKNLYALGIDAYQLAPRIPQLLYTPGLEFEGTTGVLSLSNDGAVTRRPSWAQFRGGIATPIEIDIETEAKIDERMDATTLDEQQQEAAPTGRYQFTEG